MKPIILFVCLCICNFCFSQAIEFKDCSGDNSNTNDITFHRTEVMPKYKKLEDSIRVRIESSLQHKKANGTLVLSLIVQKDGTCCLSSIERDWKLINTDLLKEKINQLSNWEPATQNNKRVKCFVILVAGITDGKVDEFFYSNYQ